MLAQPTDTLLVLDFLRAHAAFAQGRCRNCGFWLDDDEATVPVRGMGGPLMPNRRQSNPGRGVRLLYDVVSNTTHAICNGCRFTLQVTDEDLDLFQRQRTYFPSRPVATGTCTRCQQSFTPYMNGSMTTCAECASVEAEFGRIVGVAERKLLS